MSLVVDIATECDSWAILPNLQTLSEKAIAAALAQSGESLREGAEVSLLFCDDKAIQALNKQWRQLDKPTNVLSFPGPDDLETAQMIGDIIIAFETTQREAVEESKPLADHVSHLIIHGFLHLLGFDHEDDDEADEMEVLETEILHALGIKDPYAETTGIRKSVDER